MMRRSRLRPARFDELGLRRAIGDRMLPLMVAAMTFLAALALSGAIAASDLARHWRWGASSVLTAQVPRPNEPGAAGQTRMDRALTLLRGTPGVESARVLGAAEMTELLRPWLGGGNTQAGQTALPLPGVMEVHLADAALDTEGLARRLARDVPDALLESHGVWAARLAVLARSLQACAGLALAVVAGVAAAVVAVATRAGLSARREAIEIVHGLGATDGWIARRFASRATWLALLGGTAGAVAALPALLALAAVASPFLLGAGGSGVGDAGEAGDMAGFLPDALWFALLGLPPGAALIGWATAQGTVRTWLRRLP